MGGKKKKLGIMSKWKMVNGKWKIYILHGWTYSTDKWQPFIEFLKENGIEAQVLTIPGLTEKTDKVWGIEDYVKWLNEKLNKEKDVVLIGHSNGGRIALAFAAESPKNLSKLILIDSAGIYHNEFPLKIKRVLFKTASKIGKNLIISNKARDLLYFLAREKDYKNASPNIKKTMVNLIQTDLTDELSKIKTPTLIIWGENDKILPLSDGRLMNGKISNSKLYVVLGARHSPQFSHVEEVGNRILEEIR